MKSKFLVPFETAKMLKKAGYPQSGSDMYYNNFGELIGREKLVEEYKRDYTTMVQYNCAAPTFSEVLDWLVQKKIYIDVDRTTERVVKIPMWHCYIWDKYLLKGAIITGSYPTREQAINAAIVRVLEEI